MTQVALVTGAGQGLGKSIAEQLLGAGYRVVISDRSLAAAQASAAQLDASGERVLVSSSTWPTRPILKGRWRK